MKTISVRIEPAFDRRIRMAAAQKDMSRSDFIRMVLELALNEHDLPTDTTPVTSTARPIPQAAQYG